MRARKGKKEESLVAWICAGRLIVVCAGPFLVKR
jgi:hypothetical protein